jgi:hypothetical protein
MTIRDDFFLKRYNEIAKNVYRRELTAEERRKVEALIEDAGKEGE